MRQSLAFRFQSQSIYEQECCKLSQAEIAIETILKAVSFEELIE